MLHLQNVREIVWNIDNPRHFLDANSGKEFDGRSILISYDCVCHLQRTLTVHDYVQSLILRVFCEKGITCHKAAA